ncbi:hypothetical protein PM082_014721 [Marasmius tenuissimus]|nr:hypothetical protein PM082_014721 [Marasmius tenuissimus]
MHAEETRSLGSEWKQFSPMKRQSTTPQSKLFRELFKGRESRALSLSHELQEASKHCVTPEPPFPLLRVKTTFIDRWNHPTSSQKHAGHNRPSFSTVPVTPANCQLDDRHTNTYFRGHLGLASSDEVRYPIQPQYFNLYVPTRLHKSTFKLQVPIDGLVPNV